jgi:2-oxoglutarate dehydrogenase E1 component
MDEFISSSEQKWGQHSSVVLLLPHGYEGQGPDHSSARIERYLAMCAEDNMTVAVPSTPASYFHLLRRQAFARPRRPLIVFTPKSMLRLKSAASGVEDLTTGTFQPVISDPTVTDPSLVDRVLLCSGKVYYDLADSRDSQGRTDIAIARVEQLYPLPVEELRAELARFPRADVVWVQEEPANQGGWPFIALNLPEHLDGRPLRVVSRTASASPAVGSHSVHEAQQRTIVESALG